MFRWENLTWALRRRAYTPYHLLRYWRYLIFRLRNPLVVTEGMVFLGRGVQVTCRPGYGRVYLGPWVHLGDHTRLFAHEGTVSVGAKTVVGCHVTVTGYLNIAIGRACMVADGTYIADFDHTFSDTTIAIKDQGLTKTPVDIGDDCWLGVRTVVLRDTSIGAGTVVGAHAVVRGHFPNAVVLAGVPARVVKTRCTRPEDQRNSDPSVRTRATPSL